MANILASDNGFINDSMKSLSMAIEFSKTQINMIEDKQYKDMSLDLRYHRQRIQVMGKFYKKFRKAIQTGMRVDEFIFFAYTSIVYSDPLQFNIDKSHLGYVDGVHLFNKFAEENRIETPYFFRRAAVETALKFNHYGNFDSMLSAYRKWNMVQRVVLENQINDIRAKINSTYF